VGVSFGDAMRDPDIYWRVMVPFFDYTIWEGMIDPISAQLLKAIGVCLWMLFIALAFERWEHFHNDRRNHK